MSSGFVFELLLIFLRGQPHLMVPRIKKAFCRATITEAQKNVLA